jgi:hypothetical protein
MLECWDAGMVGSGKGGREIIGFLPYLASSPEFM